MQKKIIPFGFYRTIKAPPSKSVAQRAIAIASLAKGKSVINNIGTGSDVVAATEVCRQLGVKISEMDNTLIIDGGIHPPKNPLNCGESGLCIRMFSPIAALFKQEIELTGSGTLKKRPMGIVEESLHSLSVYCNSDKGKLPIRVRGPLKGGRVFMDASLSSQVLTGILIAAPYAANPLEIHVGTINSLPYIDLTMEMMKSFGVEVKHDDYHVFHVPVKNYSCREYTVEGDWSGASFLLVAGAIAGKVRITGLNKDSAQADKQILKVLKECGAWVEVKDDAVIVEKKDLHPFSFDATHCPDLFPPLLALAASCKGVSSIKGVNRLKGKESNRALTLQQEFMKLGTGVDIDDDVMIINGGSIKGAEVHSHFDHRIAMACAIAGLCSENPVTILEAQAVEKSYPDFFDELLAEQ